MDKFRYGRKEIIATIIGAVLLVFVEWLQNYLISSTAVPESVDDWIQLRIAVVAVVAVFSGPISGMLCGLGGDLLIKTMFEPVISYPEVLVIGLYGFVMGFYFCVKHSHADGYSPRDFLDLNAVQIATGIFCALFLLPFMKFMRGGENIHKVVTVGAKSVVGNSVVVGFVCSLIMVAIIICTKIRARRS